MRLIAFIFVTVLMAAPARAEWRLNPDLSHLSFGSEKKGAVGEVHHFSDLAGEVDATGRFSLVINLASLETWIDIRKKRRCAKANVLNHSMHRADAGILPDGAL